jgi:hypothetical protein
MRILTLLAVCVVATLAIAFVYTEAASPHSDVQKPVYEHAVDVERFFHTRTDEATRVRRAHARLAYRALIYRWGPIHRCEGSWTDTSGTYQGGLQFDDDFADTWGWEFQGWWGESPGLWPPAYQMVAAQRAYAKRGFDPWPYCGRYGR